MGTLSAEEARDILLCQQVQIKTERVGLWESLGRVLAEDISSCIAVPPFDRSPFDGYALRGEDTLDASQSSPAVLRITEEIPAGTMPTIRLTKGLAAKILTGAPIPAGANATIKYEDTQYSGTQVSIFAPVNPGTNIVLSGEDILPGTPMARRGDVISSPHVGLFAGQGMSTLAVYSRPRVAILNSGTELLEVGQPIEPAKIYNSNVYTLSGYLHGAGAVPVNAGTVEDDPGKIASRLERLFQQNDMVITTGGASVGDYDWAVRSAQMLGAKVLFWKCAMKPGGSLMAALKDGKLLLGLSGNPGAAVVGLIKIGMPFIKKLCGRSELLPEEFFAVMAEPYKKKSPVPRIVWGRLEVRDGIAYFRQTQAEGNGLVSPLIGCDLVGQIPAGTPGLAAGDKIKVFRI